MATYYFYFTPDAFDSNGVHDSIIVPSNVGSLTVSGVPEPSAFWLLLSAVAAIFTIRAKFCRSHWKTSMRGADSGGRKRRGGLQLGDQCRQRQ